MIPQRFIEEVQTRTDIADVIAGYIPIKKSGRNFKALCPFHGEKTPSFMISPQKQIFHCFGCGQGGGALQFVMLYEKTGFVEAVEILAQRAGLEVPREYDPQANIKSRLYEVVAAAADFFHKNLLSEYGKTARKYLNDRGVGAETVKKFQLGLSPSGNALTQYLREKGFTLQMLEQASLSISRGDGYRDLFRERLMFPIFDVRSRPVAFGARLLANIADSPKYINSIEGSLYSKRDHLYGLNFSKDAAIEKDALVVVEGYLDMISPFMCGIKNIAASLGTALTVEQIRIVRRYTANVFLLFDSDKAGQNASLRALDLLLENDLKVSVISLPQGDDPDTLARKQGQQGFLKLLETKQDFFDYKLGIVKRSLNIETIDGKSKIAAEMLGTIARLNNEISRYEYVKRLADALKVKEEVLIAEFKKLTGNFPRRHGYAEVPAQDGSQQVSLTEKIVLKFLLAGEKTAAVIFKNVVESDFLSPAAQKTAGYIFSRWRNGQSLKAAVLLNEATPDTARILSSVMMDEDIVLDKETLKEVVVKLRKNRLKEIKEKLKGEIKNAEAVNDAPRLKELMIRYNQLNSEVRNA